MHVRLTQLPRDDPGATTPDLSPARAAGPSGHV